MAALVSNYLAGVLKNDMTVTVGQGRNVAAVANHVGVFPERHCRFICGIGGTKRDNQLIDADHISRIWRANLTASAKRFTPRPMWNPGAARGLYAKPPD
ncbi:transcriptional regulator [Klebsiella pneumoniae]|uniref:Transcriptional regulator n=1 Tax=Klebsiella pneumoniae TaxID=573 RepID=A0A378BD88_KLEPN|nr:transcriptional regulator [Klebsiella pneumoniae]